MPHSAADVSLSILITLVFLRLASKFTTLRTTHTRTAQCVPAGSPFSIVPVDYSLSRVPKAAK